MNVKISDFVQKPIEVDMGGGKTLPVRALSLTEMMELFMGASDIFLSLYAEAQQPGSNVQKLAPLLIGAPGFVAQALAMAFDAVGQEEDIRNSRLQCN